MWAKGTFLKKKKVVSSHFKIGWGLQYNGLEKAG